jgi:hypothetical protein
VSLPVDLIVDPLDDLQLSASGDLAYTENYNNSVLRRLSTPVNGYSRFVFNQNSVEAVDTEVFSRLYNFLSSPLTELSLDLLESLVTESLSEDKRVELLSVESSSNTLTNSVTVEVTYRDSLTDEVSSLTVSP